MNKVIDLKYTIIGLSIAALIGYLLSLFTELSFWLAFGIVAFAMIANGMLAEYEDNLPGGFNNPMPGDEIEAEKVKSRKKQFPLRLAFWVFFIALATILIWVLSS